MIRYTARGRTARAAIAVPATRNTPSTEPGSLPSTTVTSPPSAAQPITTKTPSRPGREPHDRGVRPGGGCRLRACPRVARPYLRPLGRGGAPPYGGEWPAPCPPRCTLVFTVKVVSWGRDAQGVSPRV